MSAASSDRVWSEASRNAVEIGQSPAFLFRGECVFAQKTQRGKTYGDAYTPGQVLPQTPSVQPEIGSLAHEPSNF